MTIDIRALFSTTMVDALLIFPKLGSFDSLVCDLPLSVLYAASESVKSGYKIKILDMRLSKDWKKDIDAVFKDGVTLAGISVMTGNPMKNAKEMSLYIRKKYPKTKICWGGAHATVMPETLQEDFIDFLVRGYGSNALKLLLDHLNGKISIQEVHSLCFKDHGKILCNPRQNKHEFIRYKDIPYHLINVNDPRYVRTANNQKVFYLFTALGCPYKCSFCVHPTIYEEINGAKWVPYDVDDVIEHIKFIKNTYGHDYFCFLDDTSFVDIERMKTFFMKIIEQNLNVSLEFRGARVNEIYKMDDEFLGLMAKAGTKMIMVGFESASDRILKIMKKGITKEQIFEVNKKLARHPSIRPVYNFFVGVPGETYEDLLETKDAILKIIKDNIGAYIGFGADWKPIPGTEMLEIAIREYGYRSPVTFDDWANMDSFDNSSKIIHPWYSKDHDRLIRVMQTASVVIDRKIDDVFTDTKNIRNIFILLLKRLYYPFALLRLKYNIFAFPIEYNLYRLCTRLLLG